MKVQAIFLGALVATVSAWTPSFPTYHGSEHIPVIQNGVPVETPEVQQAKAAHFAALAEASDKSNGESFGNIGVKNHGLGSSISYAYKIDHIYNVKHEEPLEIIDHIAEYEHQEVPQINYDGTPLDTAEVEAAKAKHFEAYNEALSKSKHGSVHYRKRRSTGSYGYSLNHQVIPTQKDTDEVQKARAEHLAAHAAASSRSYAYSLHQIHSPHYATYSSHEIPKIDHDGKPLDTAEVEAAKTQHFAAYNEALARVFLQGSQHYRKRRNVGFNGLSLYQVPQVPEETYEVQKARAEHLAAHAATKSGSYGYSNHQIHDPHYTNYYSHEIPEIGHDGKPLDTAEVEEAKSKFFSAYNEALLRGVAQHSGHNDVGSSLEGYHY